MSGAGARGPGEDVYDAAAAMDALLGAEDSELLASLAWFRANLASLFGREGFMRMVAESLSASPCVRHFSARSEREFSPARPSVRLRVDDAAAAAAHPRALLAARLRGADFGYGRTPGELERINAFKSAVVFAEVCSPVVVRMHAALAPHWPRAKRQLVGMGAREETLRLLVSTIFGVATADDPAVHSRDKMVRLTTLI